MNPDISLAHRRYALAQGIVGGVINLALNAAIGWALARTRSVVPIYGPGGLVGDSAVTAFLVALLVCLILTPLVRGDVRRGRVPAATGASSAIGRLLPKNLMLRALTLGVVATAVVTPLVMLGLGLFGVSLVSVPTFVGFKGVLAAAVAFVVAPLATYRALGEQTKD